MTSTKKKEKFVLHTRVVTGTGGGPEKTILNSPASLSGHGYESACLYLHPCQDPDIEKLSQKATQSNAELILIEDGGLFDFSVIRKLLRICKQRNVAIWHAHDYKSNVLGLIINRFYPMKLVTTIHGWGHQTSKLKFYYWIDKQAIRFYDHVICVSNDLYELTTQVLVKEENCSLIQNSILTSEFKRKQSISAAKKSLQFSPDCTLIGAVGRLSEEKGFHLLIAACEKLIQSGHNIELALLGEGQQRDVLEKQIAGSSFADRFHLLGYQAQTIPYFEAMDLFVLSSLREGLPNVLLEAMAMEVPVVSTKVAGVANLIEDSVHGILVDSVSADAISAGIKKSLENDSSRSEMVKNARERVENEFSFEKRMAKVSHLYDQLLDK